MKYFICVLGKIQIGIPTECTERLIQAARIQTSVYETENQEAFISLPALLRQKDAAAPHGLVLKTGIKSPAENPQVKTILLTPSIDIELEIPEANIHRLPEAFVGLFSCFSGICFIDSSQNPILMLNPKKLVEDLQ